VSVCLCAACAGVFLCVFKLGFLCVCFFVCFTCFFWVLCLSVFVCAFFWVV